MKKNVKVKDVFEKYINGSYKLQTKVGEVYFINPEDYFKSYLGYYNSLDYETLLFHAVFGYFTYKGKKYRHPLQELRINYFGNEVRIKLEICERMLNVLLKDKFNINTFNSFDSLHKYLLENKVYGFGPLAIYDLALRLSYTKNMLPSNIYIHGGTGKGYKSLCHSLNIVPESDGIISVKSLPVELQKIQPFILEDFFCVCKNNLKF